MQPSGEFIMHPIDEEHDATLASKVSLFADVMPPTTYMRRSPAPAGGRTEP
jgi:hypothetical protein